MILDELVTKPPYNVIFEQDTNEEQENSEEQDESQNQEPPEFTPLRKHYLIERLFDLKYKLRDVNITNPVLDTVLDFSSELSYETLVVILDKLTDVINTQLEEAIKNAKKK